MSATPSKLCKNYITRGYIPSTSTARGVLGCSKPGNPVQWFSTGYHRSWNFCRPNLLIIDQALDKLDFPLESRKICLKYLYRTCGHHELLPKTPKAPIRYGRGGCAKYYGGYADVWKGECRGLEVAVKVTRTCSESNLRRVVGVSHLFCSLSTYLKADSAPRRGSTRRS